MKHSPPRPKRNEAVPVLRSLDERGIPLIVCLCLTHFGLVDKVKVGTVSGMPAFVAAQWAATKVIAI